MPLNKALDTFFMHQHLSREEANDVMHEILAGKAEPEMVAAFLTGLRIKGETIEEITGMAEVMREKANNITIDYPVLDTCGTGGDGAGTFNVSTTTAFVLAAGGVKIAKHGNRSVSSRSGSVDVLEELGVNINLGAEGVKTCLDEVGIGFMYAPGFHSAMKHVMPIRKKLGIRTVFNILGPLTNPAHAKSQILGVYDPSLTETLAYVLKNLGTKRAYVVYGSGLDEICIHGNTKISELNNGKITTYSISPEVFGISLAPISEIVGGDKKVNAFITDEILKGEEIGPKRDIVIANASAGFVVANRVKNLSEGAELARSILQKGSAHELLQKLKEVSHRFDH